MKSATIERNSLQWEKLAALFKQWRKLYTCFRNENDLSFKNEVAHLSSLNCLHIKTILEIHT